MSNLKFLASAYRELWPVGKNEPPRPYKGSKKPGLNRVKLRILNLAFLRFNLITKRQSAIDIDACKSLIFKHTIFISTGIFRFSKSNIWNLTGVAARQLDKNQFKTQRMSNSRFLSPYQASNAFSRSSQWRCSANYLFCSCQEAKIRHAARKLNMFEVQLLGGFLFNSIAFFRSQEALKWGKSV